MQACTHICMYACMHACMQACMHVCTCARVQAYVQSSVHVCGCRCAFALARLRDDACLISRWLVSTLACDARWCPHVRLKVCMPVCCMYVPEHESMHISAMYVCTSVCIYILCLCVCTLVRVFACVSPCPRVYSLRSLSRPETLPDLQWALHQASNEIKPE